MMENPEKLKPHKKKQDYPYAPSESSHKGKESKREILEENKFKKELNTDEIIEISPVRLIRRGHYEKYFAARFCRRPYFNRPDAD